MCTHHLYISLMVILSSLAIQSYAQGTCTSPDWAAVSQKKLDPNVQSSLQFGKSEAECKTLCTSSPDCVTFDMYPVGGTMSCFTTSSYTPLVTQTDSTHWEYRQSCTSSTGMNCSFLYMGEYTMSAANSFTPVTASSSSDCLLQCVASSTCKVATFDNTNQCQHSTAEQTALDGRTRQTGWSQYLKDTCTTATTSTSTTTTTTSQTTTTPIPTTTSCANGGTNQWTSVNDKHVLNGVEQSSAQTLIQCRDKCLTINQCNAIDYKDSATGTKCWTFTNLQNPQLLEETGVVHETVERCFLSTTTSTPLPTTATSSTTSSTLPTSSISSVISSTTTISTSSVTTAGCTNGGTNQWTSLNDMHVLNGVAESAAQTLDQCRQKCLTSSGCNAIDYNPNGIDIKCWIFTNLQNPQLLPETGVVHETLDRCVLTTTPGPDVDWDSKNDTHVVGGLPQSNVNTLEQCRENCKVNLDCTALDYKESGVGTKCWLFINMPNVTLEPEAGVVHETILRNPSDSTTSITTASTTSSTTASTTSSTTASTTSSTTASTTSSTTASTTSSTNASTTSSTTSSTSSTTSSTTASTSSTSVSTTSTTSSTSASTTSKLSTTVSTTTTIPTTVTTPTTTTTTSTSSVTTAPCPNGGTNQWTAQNDVHVLNGVAESSAKTLDQCKQICVTTPGCNAIDYKSSGIDIKCWIFINLQNAQVLPETGVVHETLERCALPTAAPCSNGGTNQWTTVNDQHVLNGIEQSSALTLEECRQICLMTLGCNAIDYNGNAVDVKCWIFLNQTNPQLLPETGVVHETLERCVLATTTSLTTLVPTTVSSTTTATTPASSVVTTASCTNGGTNQWTSLNDTHVLNGVAESAAQTLDQCRQKCLTSSGCNAIDYNPNGIDIKCWIFTNLQNPQLLPETGVVHETLDRCVLTTITSSTSSESTTATTSTTTSTMSTTSVTSVPCTNGGTNQWTSLNDTHVLNGVAENSAQTLDQCRQICLSRTGCNAIDYNSNAVDIKCWIFTNLQNPQLLPETGVIHETLERCVVASTTSATTTAQSTTSAPPAVTTTTRLTTVSSTTTSSTSMSPTTTSASAMSTTTRPLSSFTTISISTTEPSASTAPSTIITTAPTFSSSTTAVRTTALTSPVPTDCIQYASQSIRWPRYLRTHGINGQIKIPITVNECLTLCANDLNCLGVDVIDMGQNTIQCWAHYSQSNIDSRLPLANSVLYVKEICQATTYSTSTPASSTSAGCTDTFTEFKGRSSPFGVPNTAMTLDSCKNTCINNPQCVGIDYDSNPPTGGAACWIHQNANNFNEIRSSPTITQYVIQRCAASSTGAPQPTGFTTSSAVSSGTSGPFSTAPGGQCLMFEGWGANANAGASVGEKKTRQECADACANSVTCRAADYDIISGQCYLHISATTLRQRNTCCYRLEKLCNTQYTCPGAEFYQVYANTRVLGGTPVTATTMAACENACSSSVDCASYNWRKAGGTSSCELLYSQGVSVISDNNWESYLKMKCVGIQTPTTTPASTAKYRCPQLDVIFIMDGSGSSKPYWTSNILPFFLDVAKVLPLDDGTIRLGAVKFSSSAGVVMKFNQGTTINAVTTIWGTPNALDVGGGTTNIGKALQVAANNISLVSEGDRTFANNKILLYTDGIDQDLQAHPPPLQEGINNIRAKNIDVFILRGGIITDAAQADSQMKLITGQNNYNNIYKDPQFPSSRVMDFNGFLNQFATQFLGCTRI